jgi:hypothetical protein
MEWIVQAMDRLGKALFTQHMTTTNARPANPTEAGIRRAIARRSFCTLATTSPKGRPHVAGLIYAEVDGELWLGTLRSSRKARNIAANLHVFVCVAVRRVPVGPPSTIQFASTAELLDYDHPEVVALVGAGRLKPITSHGELALPDGCMIRVAEPEVFHTYGLGLPLHRLIRDPLNASGRVEVGRRTGHQPTATR